jgi:spermidine synthase
MKTRPIDQIIYYREGASDTILVTESKGLRRHRTLIYADGRGAAGTWTLRWNLYMGHLPMLLHPDPQEVLHICFGSGNSVMALTRHDPERIDAVELSPHIKETASYFWTNENVLDHPKVNLIVDDGRNFLLRTRNTYDVISMEPPVIHSAGVVNLYTREFYELARTKLKPGGIVEQWLPTGTMPKDDRSRLIRAFTDAFPYTYIFQELDSTQLLILGMEEPLLVDVDAVDRRLRSDALAKDALAMQTPSGVEFLSYFLLGDEATRQLGADFLPATDDRTIVDYTIPFDIDSGFGLNYTYPLGEEGYSHQSVTHDRLREYARWQDPASTIIPDPDQARRVDEAIAQRRISSRRSKEMRRKLRALQRQQE